MTCFITSKSLSFVTFELSLDKLKWIFTYGSVEDVGTVRKEEIIADNINCAFKRADEDIKEGEKIVRVRVKRRRKH